MVPIALALPFVATLVFPFKKPQLFAQTLGGKNEALKLVLLSVVCLVTFVIYTLCLIVPFNSGIYLGTSLSLAAEVVAAFVLVGIGLYVVANYRLRKAGIDLRRVYDEIPPE